jgi:ABC-type multidrug transport system fused ATPase/permease subunit
MDPLYHTQRDSGAIIAKIERAARSYENLLDAVLIDIVGYSAGIIAAVISCAQVSVLISVALLVMLAAIVALHIKLAFSFILPREQELIKVDDTVKSISQENLMQMSLIRSYFASNEINYKLKNADMNIIQQERKLWNTNITIWSLIKTLYVCTVFTLGLYLLHLIINDKMSVILGISLIVTYIQGTYGVISVERPIRVTFKSIIRIKDLFSFLQNFGKQTYPVLRDEDHVPLITIECPTITIKADNITFTYNQHTTIFEQHNLFLDVSKKQSNKLYGIIGPSGVGKSTLLLILGGQLHPFVGTVTICNTDVYEIDDEIRKSLIALQGQLATSLRGTLRYNLLFGLPVNTEYDDTYLKQLLHRIGLWQIFKAKNGLETKIGEAGLTLSGGQRQRLNFASLYLRANFYKPPVILIDEPTSSLDEISEQAITDMVNELAKKSVTIVIAHRLKTIQTAQGILDFSLIGLEKNLRFYTQQELLKKSVYYQQLMRGKISLEE